MSERPLDVIIYGATGFTGSFIAGEVINVFGNVETEAKKKSIGLCGRSMDKLNKLMGDIARRMDPEMAKKCGDLNEFYDLIVVPDINDSNSLSQLTTIFARSKLVIMCAGPFRLYGEPVVKACCEAGTNYIDICGEPEFIEAMELKYNDIAKSKNIIISSACGFDSIPADVGTMVASSILYYEKDAFPCHVESFLTVSNISPGCGNFATYESAVLGFGSEKSLKQVRKGLSAKRKALKKRDFPNTKVPKLHRETSFNGVYNDYIKSLIIPFPGADASVVRRTQMYFEVDNEENSSLPPPVQYAAYATIPGKWVTKYMKRFGLFAKLFGSYKWGREYLLNNASYFTGGAFGKRGQNPRDDQRNIIFEMNILASGITKSKVSGGVIDKKLKIILKGKDPGYEATAKLISFMGKKVVEIKYGNDANNNNINGVLTPGTVLRHQYKDILQEYQKTGAFSEVIVETLM